MGPVSEPLYHNNSNSSQNGESESEGQQQNPTLKSPLNCPRCNSTNTKFCYYNNYSRLQPRHFCRSCRRHWTAGGTLRDVPFGGGRKYTKRRKMPENYNNNPAGAASASAETIMDTNLLFPPPPPLGDAAYLPHGSFSANDVESAFVGSMYDFVNVYDEVGPAWQLPETIPAGYWDEITDLM